MPWFFSIPEFLKKRACRYLLQHYLGQFLEEKISLEDLTVDLYNGTGSIHNIPLNVQAINDTLKGVGLPVQVVSGFIEQVTVSVPWAALLTESCTVQLSGLTVCVAPQRLMKMEEYMSMTDSLFFSMTTSRQMAEEVLRGGSEDQSQNNAFEGMETLARAIELVLARVQISLKDVVFQISYEPPDVGQASRHFLQLRIGDIEYYDEVSKVEAVGGEEGKDLPVQTDFAVKVLQLSDLSVELGTSPLPSPKASMSESLESSCCEPPFTSERCGVPLAVAGGKVTVKVTLKQTDSDVGPKVEVEGFLGSLHLLLSPHQLNLLQEMVQGITLQANSGAPDFERLLPGQSRPIPQGDRTTLECQLSRHQLTQQHRSRGGVAARHKRQDLLDADPWEDSASHRTTALKPLPHPAHPLASDSMSASVSDNFYSLDLSSSCSTTASVLGQSVMEDSFTSTTSQLPPLPAEKRAARTGSTVHRRCSDDWDEAIPLHEGVGLQQLSQSPPLQQPCPPRKPGPTPQSGRLPHLPSHRYSLALSGMTVALLEADPAHTYTTPLDSSGGVTSTGCSMDEGGLDVVKYFELVSAVLKDGVDQTQFELHHKTLAHILPADHLMLWVSVVRAGVEVQEERGWECQVTVGAGEVWEHLYHNHTRINHITMPVSVSPVFQLHGDPTVTPPRPGVKLKVSTSSHVRTGKKSHASSPHTLTTIEAFLSGVHVNFDLTLVDRLQLLLHGSPSDSSGKTVSASLLPPTGTDRVKHSLYMTSSNMHTIHQQRQAVFNQAVAPASVSRSRNHRLSLKISGDVIHGSLRFPVPVSGKAQQPPWFTSALRNEVLFLEMKEWSVASQLHPQALAGEAPWKLDYQFALAQAYLSLVGSVQERQLFLVVSKKSEANSVSSSLDAVPTISVEVQPAVSSSLEQEVATPPSLNGDMLDLLEESMTTGPNPKPHPQPFSQQRSMFSAGDNKGVQQGTVEEELHSEEQVLPGTVSEMKEFADFASSTAQYHMNCFFPEVRVHLPSKHFLETLYNRLGSDLLLWEPATPTSASKANAKSVMYSCMDLLQPAATSEERFLMCKSVLQEESSDEEAEAVGPSEENGATRLKGLSFLAVSVRIDEGLVSLLPEVPGSGAPPTSAAGTSAIPDNQPPDTTTSDCVNSELFQSTSSDSLPPTLVQLSPAPQQAPPTSGDRGECGVAVMELNSVQMFFVSCFRGDPTHDSMCVWVQDWALYHRGNPTVADYEQYNCVEKTFDLSICQQLLPVFGPSPSPASSEQPMLSVAMESSLNQQNSTKTSKVSVCVNDAAMLYHFTPAGQGAIQQLASFLDVRTEEMEGHDPPSLVVELHVHLRNCLLEYRPLYLPLVATLVLDSVSLSTSVVGGAPVHVVNVVLDGLHLLLTPSRPRPQDGAEQRSEGGPSVCVMDLEWLQVTFKHCDNALLHEDFQKLFSQMPDVSVECASNAVHFRLCEDSCVALCDLLQYISSQQDLACPPPPHTSADYCTLPTSLPPPPPPTTHVTSGSGSPLTSRQSVAEGGVATDIGDLISDAMTDSSPTNVRATGHVQRDPHVPKMTAVQVSGESLTIDFDSDSDTEEDTGQRSEGGKPRLSPELGGVKGKVNLDDIFDSDDDFCIVNTPTSTKVAPGAAPKVKSLLEEGEELLIVDDHFSLPDGQMDQLQRPRSFPLPHAQYTLKEMTVVWHLFGGRDFSTSAPPPQTAGRRGRGRGENGGGVRRSGLRSWGHESYVCGAGKKMGGGVGRDHTVLVEVELDKVRLQYELYPAGFEQSGRLVLLVSDVEVRDRLADSHINKLLYQYTTEAMPKQSHASMVTLKVVFTQSQVPSQHNLEEASVYLSVLPVRLNMDQDTVLFLCDFARHVSTFSQLPASSPEPVQAGARHPAPAPEARGQCSAGQSATNMDTDQTVQQVFIKSFTFHPDLPIRIDYEAKGFKTEMGTIAGILFGLSHLNNSEVNLKALHYKKGLLGWDKLVEYATGEWVGDIRSYQLPLLLKGVGPMHNVTQLVYGLMDFVRLPYQQYQEDGRLVWGLQRGTTALTSSTGVAVVELTSQLLETVQGVAQMAYDLVSPSERPAQPLVHQHKPYQPLDFREGFSNAYDVVYAGIGGTAVDLYSVASKEHQERGVAGAVGGVLRHLPGTFVKPIILASEATRHVLGGVKNQFVPDARREAQDKWKSEDQVDDT